MLEMPLRRSCRRPAALSRGRRRRREEPPHLGGRGRVARRRRRRGRRRGHLAGHGGVDGGHGGRLVLGVLQDVEVGRVRVAAAHPADAADAVVVVVVVLLGGVEPGGRRDGGLLKDAEKGRQSWDNSLVKSLQKVKNGNWTLRRSNRYWFSAPDTTKANKLL